MEKEVMYRRLWEELRKFIHTNSLIMYRDWTHPSNIFSDIYNKMQEMERNARLDKEEIKKTDHP